MNRDKKGNPGFPGKSDVKPDLIYAVLLTGSSATGVSAVALVSVALVSSATGSSTTGASAVTSTTGASVGATTGATGAAPEANNVEESSLDNIGGYTSNTDNFTHPA